MGRDVGPKVKRAKRKPWAKDDPRYERVAEKRSHIVQAAKVIFLSEGYAAASMDRISEQAGVSKMTVYRHFKDKEALFVETINQQCDGIYQFGSHEPAASKAEAISELKLYGAAFIDLVTAPDVLGIYQTLLGEMLRFPDLGRMFFDIVIEKSIDGIRRILSGIFPPEQVEWRAPAFMHLVMGDSYQRLSLGKLTRAECLKRSVEEIDRAAQLIVCDLNAK